MKKQCLVHEVLTHAGRLALFISVCVVVNLVSVFPAEGNTSAVEVRPSGVRRRLSRSDERRLERLARAEARAEERRVAREERRQREIPSGPVSFLTITGDDLSNKIGSHPTRYLVYQGRRGGPATRTFILIGVDDSIMTELPPGTSHTLMVIYLGTQRVRMSGGSIRTFPAFRVFGTERVIGVGGDVMYYR